MCTEEIEMISEPSDSSGGSRTETGAATASTNRRPVITPDPFSGEGRWDDWISHFDSVADVNGWDEAAKLLWLRVRLTGRAQTAFKQLSETTRASYTECIKGLQERFEPACKKDLYLAEFQARRKRKEEDWASFAEDLRVLADKAFPELQKEAKEHLTLTHFLGQIDNPQIAFGVKQQHPKKLETAVTSVIELESYLQPKPRATSARVGQIGVEETQTQFQNVVTGVQAKQDAMMEMLTQIVERLEKLEKENAAKAQPQSSSARSQSIKREDERGGQQRQRTPVICRRCNQEGHFARGCAQPRTTQQGN